MDRGDDLVHEPDAPPSVKSSSPSGWRWLWLLVPIAMAVGLALWIIT
jgi:hypothetical protein